MTQPDPTTLKEALLELRAVSIGDDDETLEIACRGKDESSELGQILRDSKIVIFRRAGAIQLKIKAGKRTVEFPRENGGFVKCLVDREECLIETDVPTRLGPNDHGIALAEIPTLPSADQKPDDALRTVVDALVPLTEDKPIEISEISVIAFRIMLAMAAEKFIGETVEQDEIELPMELVCATTLMPAHVASFLKDRKHPFLGFLRKAVKRFDPKGWRSDDDDDVAKGIVIKIGEAPFSVKAAKRLSAHERMEIEGIIDELSV
jgi:hypothetical protein